MKYLVCSIFSLLFYWGSVTAQERGIGVSPAKIEIGQGVEWPYTVPIAVTNFSSQAENFEVTFEKGEDTDISALPGRFALDAGVSGRVLVTFEKPRQTAEGLVKVVSTRTSLEGFTTGTGVKIPFRIEKADGEKFLAGASEALGGRLGFRQLFGAGMILATILLLWQVAIMVRSWMPNSNKQ